jgi:hypothetical protein
MNLLATLVYQRSRAGQAELLCGLLEVGKVYAVFECGDRSGSIDAAFSADLLHEVDAKAKLSQTQYPTKDSPGVAAVERLVSDHAAHHDRRHLRDPPNINKLRTVCREGACSGPPTNCPS